MLEINNIGLFKGIVAESVQSVYYKNSSQKTQKSWVRAIAKAAATVEGDTTFIHWNKKSRELVVWSSSNEIYTVGAFGCECKAFSKGVPCYHRAMKRLVEKYYDRLASFGKISYNTRAINNSVNA